MKKITVLAMFFLMGCTARVYDGSTIGEAGSGDAPACATRDEQQAALDEYRAEHGQTQQAGEWIVETDCTVRDCSSGQCGTVAQ